MTIKKDKIAVVVLSAGKGTRLGCVDKPKVMLEINGRPMVDYIVENLEKIGLNKENIFLVVGFKQEKIRDYFGDRVSYVYQSEQLGTGHAVAIAEKILKDKFDQVVVLYGDIPFIKGESIKKLIEKHLAEKNILTFLTTEVPDFFDWRQNLNDCSRIVRDENNQVVRTVEVKDANKEELNIKEINPCFYCFEADWLWENLRKLKNNNAQKEYYLPDLIKIAFDEKVKVSTIKINPREAVGINTYESLKIANQIL